jgi:signal transduction histidine kinase
MRIQRFKQAFQIIVLFTLISTYSTPYAEPDQTLTLSDAERHWIKQHPVIRLASDNDWPPFEWITEAGHYRGIAADYIDLIEQKLGIRFITTQNLPWPEVVNAVKAKKLDVFSCVAKNPQRQQYVNFTQPYLSFAMVFITSHAINYLDGIDNLQGLRVGVVKGYATHEYLSLNHPTIELHTFANSQQGLQAVSQGRVDVFVDNIATASTIIQRAGLTNLKISGEMPVRYELSMAVRNDWPELVDLLQRALDSISEEQRKQIHNKWIGVRYEHGTDYALFWKSLIAFLTIIGLLYFYNRKLSREILKRKSAQQAALIAKDEADKANQSKSEFLSVMSHELRTPLTSIKGALGILSSGKIAGIPDKALKLLKVANENSDRLVLLINDILDFEKLLAGRMPFHKEPIVLEELINEAITLSQGYAQQYKVTIKFEKNVIAKLKVNADKNRLTQVLLNLLSNAIKYSPENGHVLVTAEPNDSVVRVSVIDQGQGVPPDFQSQIFSHFSQADTSNTRAKGGTGLGLAISKEIIERHEGRIGFNSPAGEGATFFFELPLSDTSAS